MTNLVLRVIVIVDFKNRVKLNKTVFYVVSRPYSIGKVNGTIAFCYNEQLKSDLNKFIMDYKSVTPTHL